MLDRIENSFSTKSTLTDRTNNRTLDLYYGGQFSALGVEFNEVPMSVRFHLSIPQGTTNETFEVFSSIEYTSIYIPLDSPYPFYYLTNTTQSSIQFEI